MPALSMIFDVIARDGASPAFRTVGVEAKALQRVMEEADAKMALSSKATADEIKKSMLGITEAERAAKVEAKTMSAEIAASMASMAEASKLAAAKTLEADAAIAKGQADLAAKTEASSVARKKSLMNVGLASALTLTAVIGESVKMAADFQQKTSILVTAAGESTTAIGHVRAGILDLAASTGASWKELSDGAYILEKAGYRDADMLQILKAGAQAAAEEGAKLSTVVGATSAVMHDYHLPASAAVSVTNGLKAAAGEAKATFEQFDAALGTVVPLAANAKISFADVSGVLAEMTQHGISADEAAQQISNSMRNLVAPNMVAQKMMAQLGISVNDVTTRVGDGPGGRGLAGTLQYLSETVLRHMGPSGLVLLNTFNQSKMAADDARTMFARLSPEAQKLADSFRKGEIGVGAFRKQAKGLPGEMGILAAQWLVTSGNANGFQQALRNGTNQSKTYNDMMKTLTGGANGLNVALNTTMGNADGTNESIKRVAEQMKNAGQDVNGWKIQQGNFNQQLKEMGGEFDKLMISLGTRLLPVLSKFTGFLADNPKLVAALAAVIGGALVTATVVWTASLIAMGAAWVIGLGPIAWAVAGIAALAAGVIYAYNHFKWFRNAADDLWANLKGGAKQIAEFTGIVVRFFERMWHDVSGFVMRMRDDVNTFMSRMWKDVPGFAERMWHDVSTFFQRMWHDVASFVERMWHDVTGFVMRMRNDVNTFVSHMWHDVTGFFTRMKDDAVGIFDAIGRFFEKHWRLLLAIATLGLGLIYIVIQDHWKAISGFFVRIWHDVAGFMSRMWSDVTGFFRVGALAVAAVVTSLWHDVAGLFTSGARATSDTTSGIWRTVTGFFSRIWHDVTGFVTRMWNDVTTFFRVGGLAVAAIVTVLWRQVVDLFTRLWTDVTNLVTRLWHDVVNLMTRMAADVGGVLGPFVMRAVAGWQSLWRGATDFASRLWHDVVGFFGRMRDDVVGIFDDLVTKAGRVWDRIKDLIAKPIKWVIENPYDKGIVPLIHGIGDILHEPGMQGLQQLHFATGGVIPGNHNQDTVPFFGTPGEGVVNLGGMAKLGRAGLDALNNSSGSSDGRHYAPGGILGSIGNAVSSVGNTLGRIGHDLVHPTDLFKDLKQLAAGALASVAGPVVHTLESVADGALKGMGEPGRWMGKEVHNIGDALLTWLSAKDAAHNAASSAGGLSQVGNGTDIVNDARKYLGQQYILGGDPYGPGGTDCSGLVDRVMADLGHKLPGRPLTWDLVKMGQAVNYGDALPGDLVFTNYGEGGIPGPGHVGIYEGNGRMIDDPNPSSHVREEAVWETPGAVRRLLVDHLPTIAAAVNGNWANVVYQALQMENLPASAAGGVLRLIQSESGGDPNAQNNWDSNARAGTPSQGLMQLIPGTFAANHWPGTSNYLRDPLANVAAGINYAVKTWGIGMLMGGGRHDGTGRYVGYANGGMPPIGRPYWVGEQGPELRIDHVPGRIVPHGESMAMTRTAPLVHIEHVNTQVDFELIARQVEFRERAGRL